MGMHCLAFACALGLALSLRKQHGTESHQGVSSDAAIPINGRYFVLVEVFEMASASDVARMVTGQKRRASMLESQASVEKPLIIKAAPKNRTEGPTAAPTAMVAEPAKALLEESADGTDGLEAESIASVEKPVIKAAPKNRTEGPTGAPTAPTEALLEESADGTDGAEAESIEAVGAQSAAEVDSQMIFHTEVTLCDRTTMPDDLADYLRAEVIAIMGQTVNAYREVGQKVWRRAGEVNCTTTSYGQSIKTEPNCSGVRIYNKSLNSFQNGINLPRPPDDTRQNPKIWKYVYGTTNVSMDEAKDTECRICGEYWVGAAYHVVKRNCNFWSRTLLGLRFGLSQQLPNVGISALRYANPSSC